MVLGAMLDQPDREHYGYALCQTTGLASGTVNTLLAALAEQGVLSSRWDPTTAGRARRRYYRIAPGHITTISARLDRPVNA